jgi:hypothetical protein
MRLCVSHNDPVELALHLFWYRDVLNRVNGARPPISKDMIDARRERIQKLQSFTVFLLKSGAQVMAGTILLEMTAEVSKKKKRKKKREGSAPVLI